MLRRLAPVLVLLTGAALTVGTLVTTATAGSERIVELHLSGNLPKIVTVIQGTTVTWENADTFNSHTSTSDRGFWKSPLLAPTETYSQTDAFFNAGTYGYHCTQHPTLVGTVRVPLSFDGTAANGYTLRWSSAPTLPAHRNFDVQIKRPGSSSWVLFKSRTTQQKVFFNPAKNGKYQFRSLTRNTVSGKKSDWSPTAILTIS